MHLRSIALLASVCFAASPLVACGGGSSRSDAAFVKDLCVASSKLTTDFKKATTDASTVSDSSKAIELLIAPINAFASAFAKDDPPDDLKQWHDDASKTISSAADQFSKTKDLGALSGFGSSPVPDPPIAAKQRLLSAAKDVKECQGVTVFKPS